MISLADVGGLYLSTPANIKDARTKAFMYACDRQIKKLLEHAEKIKVWCAIESVDEKYLDYMAADCRALLYNSSADINVRRNLIINSQYWHSKLGTYSAMQDILNSAFPDNEIIIREWFEYDGRPFFFKITTDIDMNKENMEDFIRIIQEIKNKRSLLEGIESHKNIEQEIYFCGTCITECHVNIEWEV